MFITKIYKVINFFMVKRQPCYMKDNYDSHIFPQFTLTNQFVKWPFTLYLRSKLPVSRGNIKVQISCHVSWLTHYLIKYYNCYRLKTKDKQKLFVCSSYFGIRNLPNCDFDFDGASDPYAVLFYSTKPSMRPGDDYRHWNKFGETRTKRNTLNPVWDETLAFQYINGTDQVLNI